MERPRLQDVAARVGVSLSTVSLVLTNSAGPSATTRERVLKAAHDIGYRPDRTASRLARRRKYLLGVMMDVRNSFHTELIEGIDSSAEALGYDIVMSAVTPSRVEHRAVEILLDFRCEALILIGPNSSAARLDELGKRVPLVAIGRRVGVPSVDVVRSADDLGVASAIGHLVGLGHRQIAFIDGGKGPIAADRRRGYRKAMRRHGLSDQIHVIAGDHTEEAGMAAGASVLAAGLLPTAVMASNDRCAVGFEDALTRAGVEVPGAVSLVGYDDSPLSQLAHVNLTTVSQNAAEQATHAVSAAVERLDGGREEAKEVVLPPRLVVRGTTAPPR